MHPIDGARRHPARTATLLIAGLLVAAPVAFYLISPLFIRTTLVEAAPSVVAAPPDVAGASVDPVQSSAASVAESSLAPSISPTPATLATPRPTPIGPTIVAQGAFHGTDDVHFGSGTASIIETEPGRHVLRFEGFSVLNGPDLFVYLSPNAAGYAADALELGRLKATDGSFNYDLPAGTDPADFASAIVWCKQFSHLFAVAPFVVD